MGQMSELAYWDKDKLNAFYTSYMLQYPNSGTSQFVANNRNSDAQVLLWCTPKFLIVAFRGTQFVKMKDIVSDLKFWNYENNPSTPLQLENLPSGHGGFRRSLMNLIQNENLFAEMKKIILRTNPDADPAQFPIYLTGHSLGAGLSQLFINCLSGQFTFSGAYHFAPPLALACDLREEFILKYGNRCYDIVNYKDYVPRAGRIGVAHFGKFYRICDDGLLYKEVEAYVKMNVSERAKELEYHKLDNHLLHLRDGRNDETQINSRSVGNFPCMGETIKVTDPCIIKPSQVHKVKN